MANKKKKGLASILRSESANTEIVKEQKPKTVYSSSGGGGLASGLRSASAEKSETVQQRAERKRSNQMRSSALVSIAKTMSKNRASNYKTTLPSMASKLRAQSASQAPKYKSSSSMASVLKSQTKAQAPKTSVSSAMASKMKSQTKVQAPKSRVTNTMARNALAPVNKYADTHRVTGGHGVGNYGFKTSVRQKALPKAKEIAEYTRKQQNKYVYTPNNDYRFDANGNMLTKKDPISIEYGKKLRAGMPSTNTAIMSWRGDPTQKEKEYRNKYGYTEKMREALDTRLNENMLEASYSPTTGEITPSKHGRAFLAGHTDAWARENVDETMRRQFGVDLDKETLDKLEAQRGTANYAAGTMLAQAEQYALTRGLLGKAGLVGKSADAISDTNRVVRTLTNRGMKTGTAKAITAMMQEMGIDQAASVPLNLVDAMKADGGANIIKRFGINQGLDVLFSGLFEIPSLRRNLHFLNGNEMNEAANAMQEGTEKLSMKIGAKGHLDTAVDETGDVARQEAVQISMFNDNGEIAVGRMPEQPIAEQPVVETPRAEVPNDSVMDTATRANADSFFGGNNEVPTMEQISDGTAMYGGLPVKYDPNMSAEASNFTTEIRVSNKFFDLQPDIQRHVLNHEVAHNYADDLMSRSTGRWKEFSNKFIKEKNVPVDSVAYRNGQRTYWEGLYGDIGATSLSETVTRAFTEYLDNPTALRNRSVEAFEEIDNYMRRSIDRNMNAIDVGSRYINEMGTPRAEVPQEPVATPAARATTVEEPKVEVPQEPVENQAAAGYTNREGDELRRAYEQGRRDAERASTPAKELNTPQAKVRAEVPQEKVETPKVEQKVEQPKVEPKAETKPQETPTANNLKSLDDRKNAYSTLKSGERIKGKILYKKYSDGDMFAEIDGYYYKHNDVLYGIYKGRNNWIIIEPTTGRNFGIGNIGYFPSMKKAIEEIKYQNYKLSDIDIPKKDVDTLNEYVEWYNKTNQTADAEVPKAETTRVEEPKTAEKAEEPKAEPKAEPKTKAQAEQPKAKASNSVSDEEIDRLVREQTKEMYDKMSTKELNAELRRLEKNPTVTPDVEGAGEMGIKEAMNPDEVAERTDIINEILNERRANGSVKPNVDRSKEEVFVSEEQVDKVFNDAIRKRSYRFETLRAYPRSGDMRIIIGDRAYDERGFRRLIREDLERTKAQVNEAINARAAKVGKQKASVEEPKAEPKAKAKAEEPNPKAEPKAEQKAEPSSAWDEIENEVDNIPTKEPPNKLKGTKSAEKVPEGVERLDSETQEAIEKSKRMTQKEKEASKKAGDYPSGMPKEMNGQPLNKGFDSITRESADTSDAAALDIMESVTMGNEGRKVSKGVKETQKEAAARWANDTDTSLKKITAATEGLKDGAMPKGYETFQEYFADVKEGMKYYRKLQEEAGEGSDAYWKAVENEADIARGAAKVTSNMGAGFRQYQEILGASPKARVIIVQKEVDKIKKQFEKLLKGKDIKPLSPEVTKMLEEAKTPVQQAEALEQASIEIWSQIPASMKEKADQWRMTSMLLNPKTHFRNIIGNFLFRPAILIKDALSVPAEKALIKAGKIDPEDATKAFVSRLNAKDRTYRDAAKKVWNEYQTLIRRSGGKYFDTVDSKGFLTSRPLEVGRFTAGKEDPNAVQRALDFLAKKNGDALEAEDAFFMKGKFVDSYSKILKARKLDPSKMTDEQVQEVIEDAAQEALRSTYRDASGLANAINKARNYKPNASAGRKVAGWAVDATLPFVKTPVNILRRAKDYSPVGFIEGAAKLTKALSNGDSKAATEAIDRMASGLTGGGICALGLFLGQNGMLDSKLEDGSEGFYKQDIGYQNYSLKLGGEDGVSISLNWAAPLSIPLFTGVEYAKMRENGLSLKDWVKFVDVAGRIFDPTMEMSVMQGPMALLEAISDGENGGDKLLKGGLSVGLNYVGQYYPTISGQAARTVDPVRRNTSSTADSTTGRAIEKWKNKQIAKTPFLSKTLEPYVNVWGEEQKTTDNALLRAAYEFGSPAYVNKIKADEVDKEIIRLNKAVASDEDKIIPTKYFSNAVSFDGGKVSLDAKDLTLYNKVKGKASKEAIRKLIKTEEYKNANNDGKREMINDVMKNANTEAKQKTLIKKGKDEWDVYTEGFTGGWKEQASTAKDAGIKAEQYYKIKTDKSVDLDENGGKSQYEVYTYLEGTDLTKSQKSALWNAYNKGWKNNPYEGGDIPEAPDPDDVELAAAKKEAETLSKAKARAEGSLAAKAFEKSVLKKATETASLLEDSGKSSKGSSRRGRSGRRGGGGSSSSKRKQTASERKFANGTGKLSSVDLEKIYKQTQGKQTKLPTVDLIKIYEQAKIKPAKVPTTSLVKAYTQVQQASKTKTPTPMDIKVKGLTKSQKKAMLKVMLKKLDTKR